MAGTAVVVGARNLVKRFGDFAAVAGIDFDVRRGEIFGFLGPNGSGKTTTIRMMLGLLQPSEGTIEVLGVPVTRYPERVRPRIGYMAQRFSLYNDLTVVENLRFYGRAYGLKGDEMSSGLSGALHIAGLEGREDVQARDLSGGWRQTLALAAAILHRPDLVFLDEPTAGVDPVSRRAFWDLLYELVSEGTTVFVTTHYMDEAEHCHRLALIQRGRIIASGTPASIKRGTIPGEVLELAPDDPARAMSILKAAADAGRLSLREVSLHGAFVHAMGPDVGQHRAAIEAELRRSAIDPGEVAAIEPSLEDVFVASMRR